MCFLDILHLALRNLRQAKLRATLTTMGVIIGVAVIVTMVSFGLGLQSNMLARFKALDLFNEILVYGRGLSNLAGLDRSARRDEDGRRNPSARGNRTPTRILDDPGIKELAGIEGVSQVYSVSGEWDLVAIIEVTDYEGVATVVTEHMTQVPGLRSTQTLTAFRAYSKKDLEQAWDIGLE